MKAQIPIGIGFYPAGAQKKGLAGILTLALTSAQGIWQRETEQEIGFLLGKFKLVEYEVKTYTSMWKTPQMKYGASNKCCKSSTEKDKWKCLMNHPEYKSPSLYNLVSGNCRDRAKKVLRECCMEPNSSTKHPASSGVIYEATRLS